jgi:hypothetical protein
MLAVSHDVREISANRYTRFAKKYKIRLTHGLMRRQKTIGQLKFEILHHEQTYRIKNGLYFD